MDEHDDVYEAALPELRRRADGNPRLQALLDEMDRGRRRREANSGRSATTPPYPGAHDSARSRPAEPLHAHEITPGDAAFLRLMANATFEPQVIVTLPSGKTINGAELTRWLEAQGGDTP